MSLCNKNVSAQPRRTPDRDNKNNGNKTYNNMNGAGEQLSPLGNDNGPLESGAHKLETSFVQPENTEQFAFI